MNKNKILPIVGVILLTGTIILALYFKSIENKIIKEKVTNSEQNIENTVEEQVEIINQEQQDILDKEVILEIENIETIEGDLIDFDNLINDPILDDIEKDLGSF